MRVLLLVAGSVNANIECVLWEFEQTQRRNGDFFKNTNLCESKSQKASPDVWKKSPETKNTHVQNHYRFSPRTRWL